MSTRFLPAAVALIIPQLSFAHAGTRGHVMLLPTQFYIIGGAAVVALTFAAMIFMVRRPLSGKYLNLQNSESEVQPNYWLSLLSLPPRVINGFGQSSFTISSALRS